MRFPRTAPSLGYGSILVPAVSILPGHFPLCCSWSRAKALRDSCIYIIGRLVSFFKILYLFIYFIFGCAGPSLLPGFSLAVVCRLLIVVASLVVEHGLESTGSVVVAPGFSCSEACGIFLDQRLNPGLLYWQAGKPDTYTGRIVLNKYLITLQFKFLDCSLTCSEYPQVALLVHIYTLPWLSIWGRGSVYVFFSCVKHCLDWDREGRKKHNSGLLDGFSQPAFWEHWEKEPEEEG